jgi:nitrate reductase NapAB chaperone NapD
MPISGVVINTRAGDTSVVLRRLGMMAGVEVHGDDAAGAIVAVLETATSEAMQDLIDSIGRDELVLHVGLTYLNTEDEAEQLSSGRDVPRPLGFCVEDGA